MGFAYLGSVMVYDYANGAFLVACQQVGDGLWLLLEFGVLFALGISNEGTGGIIRS